MNRFILEGFIGNVQYLPDSCILTINEYEQGYTKGNGEYVDDKFITWKVIFKGSMKAYISKFFKNGMLVDIDAKMLPYAVSRGEAVDGYSCNGIAINMASYPRQSARQEMKMMRESQQMTDEAPDLEEFNKPDF